MTDIELIEEIKYRPDSGIALALQAYGPLIKGVLIKILGKENECEVQECMSQVFVRLWQYGSSFDPKKGSLKNYLVTIARHEAFKALATIQQKRNLSPLESLDLGLDIDMTHEVAKEINKGIVGGTIEALKEPDRQIFIRRYFWGERIKTIALALQLDDKFVENRLYLVKRKMKKQLIERGIIL